MIYHHTSGAKMKIHDYGEVELIDTMPVKSDQPLGLEAAIVRSARVSVGTVKDVTEKDAGLITRLFRDEHTSPFESVKFTFRIKCPIFVARQILRHRTANVNEWSQRYSTAMDEFFSPANVEDGIRLGGTLNKQSSKSPENVAQEIIDAFKETDELLMKIKEQYAKLLKLGVAREVARYCLPLATYTQLYFTMDLHNLTKFIELRTHPGAQKETRDYAEAMWSLVTPLVPITAKAFEDYRRKAIKLSTHDIEAIAKGEANLGVKSKDEQEAYLVKLERLALK